VDALHEVEFRIPHEGSAMNVTKRYPPPGRRIRIDGVEVHVVLRGTGTPTVVFESGVGGNSLDWTGVMAAVPEHVSVMAYDRLGLGWSDPPREPRSPDRIVDELRALLGAIGANGPFVIVAHSQGSRYARLFASRHPESVDGLVLVDGFHEGWDAEVGPQALASFVKARIRFYRMVALMSKIGVLRLLGGTATSLLGPDFRALPKDERARYVALLSQPSAMETAIDELRRSGEASSILADTSFGDIPVAVMTHGVPFPDASQERAWQETQAAMAVKSSRGRLITASGAGHSIMIANPRLVADTLARIIAVARPPAVASS
jgi:pimeloyl-ACP methyl ester carboxylesterase